MISFPSFFCRVSSTQLPRFLYFFHRLSHSIALSSTTIDTQLISQSPIQSSSPNSGVDPAKSVATQLSNCANIVELNQIYCQIIRSHFLKFYPAPFHWNNIIRSYVRLEFPQKGLYVFITMLRYGVLPDSYTIPMVLKALCQMYATEIGRQIHAMAIRLNLGSDEFCESGFISLYTKAGEFENAHRLFEENPNRKLGSWNAIIGGLSQNGRAKEAISMFVELKRRGFKPDDVTMVTITSACGSLGDLSLALQVHKCVFQAKSFKKLDILMLNSLIDMYGKCGRMDLAHRIFSKMDERNVSSWTSMIVSNAIHGHVRNALDYFSWMRKEGTRPNFVTFIGVLTACVHGGMVKEGKYYFHMMQNVYGIMPRLQHYGCMVDMLGRAGLLKEAKEMIMKMPMKANSIIYGCLLGACEKYGDVKMGKWVAEHLQELEPWNDGVYVVLSNIFADNGLWEEVESVREIMKERRLAKLPGYSLSTTSD